MTREEIINILLAQQELVRIDEYLCGDTSRIECPYCGFGVEENIDDPNRFDEKAVRSTFDHGKDCPSEEIKSFLMDLRAPSTSKT
jgi:hypothetical protein